MDDRWKDDFPGTDGSEAPSKRRRLDRKRARASRFAPKLSRTLMGAEALRRGARR